jgi:hypothetical protein
MPAPAYDSGNLKRKKSVRLAIFLLQLELLPTPMGIGKCNTFYQKEKRKRCKTDSNWYESNEKILESGKRKLVAR